MNEFARKALELADEWMSRKQRYESGDGHWTAVANARAALVAHLEGAGQVARRATLEEAAQICGAMHDEDRPGDYAYAIRALANEAKG
jgi:hypothetical protein